MSEDDYISQESYKAETASLEAKIRLLEEIILRKEETIAAHQRQIDRLITLLEKLNP